MTAGRAADAAIRVVLSGAAGRMGQAILRALQSERGFDLVAAVDSPVSGRLGADAGAVAGIGSIGVPIIGALHAALESRPDVVVDFSQASALPSTLGCCVAARVPLFIGTTGFGTEFGVALEAAARDIPLLAAPNTSLGVTLLIELVRAAVAALPGDFDVEIVEAHHRLKRDAPSGTALALGAAAAAARGRSLDDVAAWSRHGEAPRRPGDIGFAVVRGGDLVGEHRVLLAGIGEQLVLEHRATDRAIFARGALTGAAWLARQPPGRYAMRDVLGLRM
jgi:4-hydroxy-tetrahydrodipicolinate reductase